MGEAAGIRGLPAWAPCHDPGKVQPEWPPPFAPPHLSSVEASIPSASARSASLGVTE